jgi:bidirectional [NiFe] hydrogenase diaphorase subunit
VKGADEIVQAVGDAYSVLAGATSEDGKLTLKTARCLGSCGLAPVVVFDGEVLAHVGADETLAIVHAAVGGGD